jgi:hypothetical protein
MKHDPLPCDLPDDTDEPIATYRDWITDDYSDEPGTNLLRGVFNGLVFLAVVLAFAGLWIATP